MTRNLSEMSPKEIEKAIKDRKQWKIEMMVRITENWIERHKHILTIAEQNISRQNTREIIKRMREFL